MGHAVIRRFVFVRLKDEWSTPEGRAEVAAYSRQALAAVQAARDIDVGTPADERSEAAWDLAIAVTFERVEDIPAYLKDPAHRSYVDDYLGERIQVLKAWNFDVRAAE